MIDTSSREAFFESTAALFHADGPGRVAVCLTDAEIRALQRCNVDIVGRDRAGAAADGAEFVVPTPAGIVAVCRDGRPPGLDLEHELRDGRHDHGYWPRGRRRRRLDGEQCHIKAGPLPPLRSSLA
jgi:hypothetical protein